jgi:DNA-directed RNA polymerase subunit RPC12/RpoP
MAKCANCGYENRDGLIFCSNCGSRLENTALDQKVKRCSFCSKPLVGEDTYYFRCRYCGQDFCSNHRLPENHLCKSLPMNRNIPSTSLPYYSTGGGYSFPTYRRGASFGLNISKPGRNLIILIVAGLVIGFLTSLFSIDGLPAVYFLVQVNALVFQGWGIPSLVTSMIVVLPNILGLEDIFFNAISVFFIDGLLRNTFARREYYLVFLITGLAGNIVSLFGEPINTVSFGASGGIFGLVAAAVSADYAINRRINMGLLLWFVIIFVYSSFGGPVDIFAHLGGALTGLLAGYFIGKSRGRTRSYF